jgi:hypothetical protein
MKTAIVVAMTLAFALVMTGEVFAQAISGNAQQEMSQAIARGKSGNFKGEVVSCDAAANTCVIKGKNGTKTGNMQFAQYNGAFNAAKELKAGDKVSGQWQEVKGVIYGTIIVKD